jgi:hypothetical protein
VLIGFTKFRSVKSNEEPELICPEEVVKVKVIALVVIVQLTP